MKPDWKDAPKWANYLAMDKGGWWFWHEEEPNIQGMNVEWLSIQGKCLFAGYDEHLWKESLESKPK